MAMIFLGGSRDIFELPVPVIERIGAIVAAEHGVLIGDAPPHARDREKAIELAPNYFAAKVLWAEFLCTKKQDKETFKKLLEEVIAADAKIDPAIAPENTIEQAKAKKLLAEIDEKF